MRILRFFRAASRRGGAGARSRRAHWINPAFESMDDCLLLSADAASSALAQATAQTGLNVLSATSTTPQGYSPTQIRAVYGIDGITFSNGTISGDGAGQTIAIVDAYADPNIASDLATFDAEYGIASPPSFTVDNLGATTTDAGWALETALDVEWAHAIAPAANIVLVEASSASLQALFGAVSYASNLAGVGVVSMSWGTDEFSSEARYDSVFTTPAGHTAITYVAASGDDGASSGVMYPAASPDVLAVGGTTLTLTASGSYGSESAWSGSTGGFSSYESEPSYQTSTLASVGLSGGHRTVPDVSFNADPSTGYSVYSSVPYDGRSGWFQIGGTSAAAPAWAGLVAIADQGLATVGQGTLSTSTLQSDLYALPSSDFNDITGGSNGYSATAGYDLVTGLGSPKANLVVSGLVADAVGSSSGTSGSGSSTSGSGVTVVSTPSGSSTSPTSPTPTPSPAPTSPTSTSTTRAERAAARRARQAARKAARQARQAAREAARQARQAAGEAVAATAVPSETSLGTLG
jgi:subtilase family serine protease